VEVFKRGSGGMPCGLFRWKECAVFSVRLLISFRVAILRHFLSVESSPVVGNAFTNSHPDWRDGTYENFKDWAVKQFGIEELDSDDEAEVPIKFRKAKDLSFEMNRRGYLTVPSMSNCRTIREKQRVVRGYIGAVYSQ
jgi:hypothetical protein